MIGINEKTGRFEFGYFLYDLDAYFTRHWFARCVVLPIAGSMVGILIGLLLSVPLLGAFNAIFV